MLKCQHLVILFLDVGVLRVVNFLTFWYAQGHILCLRIFLIHCPIGCPQVNGPVQWARVSVALKCSATMRPGIWENLQLQCRCLLIVMFLLLLMMILIINKYSLTFQNASNSAVHFDHNPLLSPSPPTSCPSSVAAGLIT